MKKKKDEVKVEQTTVEEPVVEATEIDLEKARLLDENTKLNDKVLRLSAEMQNMRRRTDEEISKMLKYEGESFIVSLLDTIDNFERAISLDDTNLDDEVSKFLSGFKMIYSKLIDLLKEQGVTEIDCLHKNFDANLMEAVMTEKVEGFDTNIVIDVMRKGYLYKDKVIMAGGTFIEGSTIELSADGPMRPPYVAYMQGGLNYSHVKIALTNILDKVYQN